MQAPKVFWWSLRTSDSVAGHVTTEETRHGLQFDKEDDVRVYHKRASQPWMMRDMIGNDLFEKRLRRDSLYRNSSYRVELSGVTCWQQQQCGVIIKKMCSFRLS
ncbi:hypothetical protein YC2023_029295 [Brassica napus]